MKTLPEEQQVVIRETVPQWRAARGKLMNHTIQTLTALKAGNATLEGPIHFPKCGGWEYASIQSEYRVVKMVAFSSGARV